MTNNQWDDDKLESLLHSMPKIEDDRSKEQIFDRLKQDQRLKKPRRMNPKKWMPIIVAAAALLLFGLIVPSMLNHNEGAIEDSSAPQAFKTGPEIESSTENETTEEAADIFGVSEAKESRAMNFAAFESHVVLADELHDAQAFQVGLVESANVVPITFLIPESVIHSDFPQGNPTVVELYNKYAAELPEAELGFDDYHPYKGKLYVENGILHHQIPAEHTYDMSEATVDFYENSMKETFSQFDELQLVDEKGNPTSFENVGKSEPIKLKQPFPYYKYTMPSGKIYLAPYEPETTVDAVAEGLAEMKNVNGDIVESLIPQNVDYDVRMDGEEAVITFKERLDVTAFDQNALNQMIEGFMLTAKEYDKQVRLENVVQESFGNYDLTKVLPKPIGSNPTWFTQ
ncbi:hypothetical protein ABE073_06895 [Lederbergia citrisecunda]|uniref:hypothetical protein n=1 Tax=Lederbergia citrisecunda TaxID=2833583 RepID=UPI003D2C7872